ncbi:MAG: YIP1 family protein [Clostridia bacterium]|nr:YIP1 family protein [Clostridia bacterium]
MKKIARIIAFMFAFVMLLTPMVMAATPYETYTYSIDGEVLESPDAYVPDGVTSISSATLGLEVPLASPSDIETDDDGNVYITDRGNNRIVMTDKHYNLTGIIDNFINGDGVEDSFKDLSSTFVVSSGNYEGLYVCDTANKRIVKFKRNQEGTYEFSRTFNEPQINFADEEGSYTPSSCVVDKHGRMYVASSGTTEGIIVLTADGDFINFIGAPKVSVSALQAVIQSVNPWSNVEFTNIPVTYTSLELDETYGDFVYGTIVFPSEDENQQLSQLTSKTDDYSPVKLLNAGGTDIMQRTGFFSPAGEVAVELQTLQTSANKDAPKGVSRIVDVTSGPDGVWSIIDNKRAKVYTYDRSGNLLYIFGDTGEQFGQITKTSSGTGAQAISYQTYTIEQDVLNDNGEWETKDVEVTKLLVLDNTGSFTPYKQTDYATVLAQAIKLQNAGNFKEAKDEWQKVLAYNNNFDTAYVEMGKVLYRSGSEAELDTALRYFQNAYDTENYATVFKAIRSNVMEKWFIPMIILIVAALFGVVKVFEYAGKVNKAAATKGGKRTLKEELTFGFHLMFHPFDGFWDLKKEKRGSVRASIIFLAITVVAFYYQGIGKGYYYAPQGTSATIISQAATVLVPFFLFVISNWCFTTLFDGEGSFKDIFVATSYSLFPLPVLVIISTALTHVLVGTESQIPTLILTVGYIYMAFLIIIGMQVTHDYSTGKNIVTIVATIAGMVIILFIVVLFTTLISKMASFVTTITSELSLR